jgi:guanine deaminase
VLYDLAQPGWLPVNDAVTQLVFSETGASVRSVLVAGELLLDEGRPTRFDPAALAEEILAMHARLDHRNAPLRAAADAITALLP